MHCCQHACCFSIAVNRCPPLPRTSTHRYHKSDAASQLKVPAQEAARVREAAKPFVEWLEQETESESDDEE